jgi:PAS domain S-box-containing protein
MAFLHQREAGILRALWNVSPDAMVLTDSAGVILAANPAYCALHGRLPNKLDGENFGVIFPEAERPSAMAHYHDVFAGRDSTPRFPARVQLRDASQRLVESRLDFILKRNRPPAMMSSVRVLPEDLTAKQDLTAEILIDGLRRWGVDAVFPRARVASASANGQGAQHDQQLGLDPDGRLDAWEDDGGAIANRRPSRAG